MRASMATLGVTWLGQSGFLYHFPVGPGGAAPTVCVDPYLSHAMSGGRTRERLTPIVVPATALVADLVVTTHDRIDHFDEITLRPIAERPEPLFLGPSSCRERWLAMGLPAERFLRLDQGESREVGGVRLTALYADHGSGDRRDAIGVVLEAGDFRVYQTGDTEYGERLVAATRGLAPDLLTLPINGRMGNMDHRQAALLAEAVAPRVVVPNHYGMFRANTADPQNFLDACRDLGLAARVVLAQPGRRFDLEPAAG